MVFELSLVINLKRKVDQDRVNQYCILSKHILLGQNYINYEQSLEIAGLESLESRRTSLCLKFAKKAAKHPKHQHWFSLSDSGVYNTRSDKSKYKTPICRLGRYKKSHMQ